MEIAQRTGRGSATECYRSCNYVKLETHCGELILDSQNFFFFSNALL